MKYGLQIKKEQIHVCPICASKNVCTVLHGKDFESATGLYNVDACESCGICFTNPRPIPEDIPLLYEKRNSSDFVKSSWAVESLRRLSVRRDLNQILSDVKETVSVADFGCGDGFFSLQLSDHPKCRKVSAIDFHDFPPPYLQKKGVPVRYCSYQEYARLSETYDIIFCRHVLEHVVNPLHLIGQMQEKLNHGGMIVLEVPNDGSVWRAIFGKYYFGLYLPRHLFHFNEKSLRNLLKEFKKVTLFRTHTPVLGRSIGYLLGKPLQNTGIIGLSLFPLQIFFDCLMRTSSVLRIVAIK